MAITKIINTIIRPSNPKNWLYKDVVLESKMPNHFTKRIFAKEVINESGEYCVSITVHQDGKSAFLINSLSVENKEYIFAKDSMEKDY